MLATEMIEGQRAFENEQKSAYQSGKRKFVADVCAGKITSAKDIADGRDFYSISIEDLISASKDYDDDAKDLVIQQTGKQAEDQFQQLKEHRLSLDKDLEAALGPIRAKIMQADFDIATARQQMSDGESAKHRRYERCKDPLVLAARDASASRMRQLELESVDIRREIERTNGILTDATNNRLADSRAFDVADHDANIAQLRAKLDELNHRDASNRAEAEKLGAVAN